MESGNFNPNVFSNQQQFYDTSHPLITNSQEYMFYKKYVSIHSQDRDFIRYPASGEFEIELPQDMLNVSTVRLVNWTFPANYSTFSIFNSNISMTFKINNPYNPNINNDTDLLGQKIFEALFLTANEHLEIVIETGFYNPIQMVTELTNKFNQSVTQRLLQYFTSKSVDPSLNIIEQQEYIQALELLKVAGGYNRFIIVYNNVSQKIWFGNIADGFVLTNETQVGKNILTGNLQCGPKASLPDFDNWGLPANLGLTRCNTFSVSGSKLTNITDFANYNGQVVPRFFYGDVFPGDNGYWLLPDPNLIGSEVHWVECFDKINLMGPAYFYMDIEGLNCIDETSPFNISEFTIKTNQTNGIVNSAFAKIAVPTTPISQWFDRDSLPYKYYYPAAERIRRLKIRFRYHNGQTVQFGVFNYSFVLEFMLQSPQLLRASKTVKYSPAGV
jgi:hypothetical protein